MEICDCYHGPESGHVFTPYCNGTKEQEFCLCKGNRKNCDFYEDVRQKARGVDKQKPVKPLPVPENVELTGFGPSKNGYRYDIFQWVAFSVDQPQVISGIEYKILFCYKTPFNEIAMNICSIDEDHRSLVESVLNADNLLYWCYIQPPKHLVDKQAAIKRLQDCGILDASGELAEAYKDILIKVEDL